MIIFAQILCSQLFLDTGHGPVTPNTPEKDKDFFSEMENTAKPVAIEIPKNGSGRNTPTDRSML